MDKVPKANRRWRVAHAERWATRMSRVFKHIAILVALAAPTAIFAADAWDSFIGTWVYESPGVDERDERLEFDRVNDAVIAVYFGMEFGGERSPYYTAARVNELSLDVNGRISFIIPPRKLFGERPATFDQAEAILGYGFTGSELKMRGRLEGETLVLQCSSEQNVCPRAEMGFRREIPR